MRPTVLAVLTLVSTLVAVPAFAGGKGDGKKFPVAAAEFKQKVDARIAKARTHMEERAAKLPADKAKEARATFDAGVAKVNAEVQKAVADGTVTKDEAHQVRAEMKSLRGAHGKHARAKGSKKPAK